MLGTNIFSSLFTGVSLLLEGVLLKNLIFCLETPALAYDVIGMSIFSMTGEGLLKNHILKKLYFVEINIFVEYVH